jgi:SAM-dependent methyltransferase
MSDDNDETTRAWNGVLFDKWVRFKHLLTAGLADHGLALMARQPPEPGSRVLDLGCGFGDTTQKLAEKLGPRGEAVGVDIAQNFIDASARDAREAGVSNARFVRADIQVDDLGGPFDAAYARFGMQFVAAPVAALRNVRRALRPGAPLAFVTWRKREDNAWLHVPELCVRDFIPEEKETADEPTCGPGPFAMRSADLVSDQLLAGGYRDISFQRHDVDICIGRTLDEALDFSLALGPSGEIIRLAGDYGQKRLPEIMDAMRTALSGFVTDKGVFAPSSSWLITARVPG